MQRAIQPGCPFFCAIVLFLFFGWHAASAESGAARTRVLFDDGMAAVEDARYDDAIAAFLAILVDRPGLVRVRLELARAFFLKGDDDLAREHFERVLAGELPAPVVANVRRYLAQIRARRRWSMYVGAALSPDSNVGSASDEEIIYIYDLPFRRNEEELVTSGIGLSVWTGGEYQHPLGDRLRLRMGGDLTRREYAGSQFDETLGSVHAGPRWLAGRRTELSTLASFRRRWVGSLPEHDARGFRFEARHYPLSRVTLNARASWHDRQYRRRTHLDGPLLAGSLSASWVVTPTVRGDLAIGYGRERTEAESWRNRSRWIRTGVTVSLPLGFTAGGSVQVRRTEYEGRWLPFVREPGRSREDRTRTRSLSLYHRAFTVYGFSPQLVVTKDVRTSNAQLHGYERTRSEMRFVRQF